MPYIPKYLPKPPEDFKPDPRNLCEQCHKPAFELRPFGAHGESICEDCANLDLQATDLRWRRLTGQEPLDGTGMPRQAPAYETNTRVARDDSIT